MILVPVGDEDCFQPVGTLFEPRDIAVDQVHTGGAVHIRESDTKIDKDQPLVALGPITIDIGVHADLTRPTKGEIDQPVLTAH